MGVETAGLRFAEELKRLQREARPDHAEPLRPHQGV